MKEHLSARQNLLLRTLNEKARPMSSKELCGVLDVSPRTLRYDIQGINAAAKEQVVLSGRNGYSLNRSEVTVALLGEPDQPVNKGLDEQLSLALLQSDEVNIYDLENTLYYSASTIELSLKSVSENLARKNLTVKKKGDIIRVEGSEYAKRRALSDLLLNEVNDVSSSLYASGQCFGHVELAIVRDMVRESLQECGLVLEEIYERGMVISLAVSLNRILSSKGVGTMPHDIDMESNEYRFLVAFVGKVNERYHMHVNEDEFCCMQTFIRGYFKADEPVNQVILHDEAFQSKIHAILDRTWAHYGLSVDDESIYERLSLHLYYMMQRAESQGFFNSEISSSMQQAHPILYDVAVYICSQIEDVFGIAVPQDEIGLITLYLGCIMDDNTCYGLCRVVCVCPSYNSMRANMVDQIKKRYPDQVIVTGAFDSIETIDTADYDFIISARKEDERKLANLVYVNPILTPRDFNVIDHWVMDSFYKRRASRVQNQLASLFNPDLFFYENVPLEGNEVLSIMGTKLKELGIANDVFIQSVLKREELASTAFYHKFAIPHSLDENAQKTVIAYLYDEKPIDWFGDKVHLVLLLATAQDYDSFMDTYDMLFDILLNTKLYQQITQAKTYNELMRTLYEV